MKLICEVVENNLEFIAEAKEDGSKNYKIKGIFMQGEIKNRNKRITEALITINKLAFVKDKSTPAILISGPILWTVNCCIGLLAI